MADAPPHHHHPTTTITYARSKIFLGCGRKKPHAIAGMRHFVFRDIYHVF